MPWHVLCARTKVTYSLSLWPPFLRARSGRGIGLSGCDPRTLNNIELCHLPSTYRAILKYYAGRFIIRLCPRARDFSSPSARDQLRSDASVPVIITWFPLQLANPRWDCFLEAPALLPLQTSVNQNFARRRRQAEILNSAQDTRCSNLGSMVP